MPWWGWLIVVIAAFVLLVVVVGTRFHKKVRREFVEYLAQAYPQFEVVDQTDDKLTLKMSDGGEGELYLEKLFNAVHAVNAHTPEQRRSVYEHFAASLLADVQEYSRKLDPATDSA